MTYDSCIMFYQLFLYQKVQNVTFCIFSTDFNICNEAFKLAFPVKKSIVTVSKSIIRLALAMAEKERNVVWLQKKCRQIVKSKCYIAFIHLNFKQIKKDYLKSNQG